jgi:predicted aspartyl protease
MQYKFKQISHCFTVKHTDILPVITFDIEISGVNNPTKRFKTKGIIDTGATNSVITKEVVDALELAQTGLTHVNTASESQKEVKTYTLDIFLKSDVRVQAVQVSEGNISAEHGFHCLIGMDIICLGDFSITNLNGKTCFSFRIPSLHEVDFVEQMNKKQQWIDKHLKTGRNLNSPCICDSKKKFKNCHGKDLIEDK